MDEEAGNMEIHVMAERTDRSGFRSGHFREGRSYSTRRPAGAADYLLIVTIAGAGYHRSGRASIRVEPGEALLYTPGVAQEYGTCAQPGRWELIWAHFPEDARRADLLRWPEAAGGARTLRLGEVAPAVVESMRDLVAWQAGGSPHRHEFAANALERVLLWCDTVNPGGTRAGLDPRVQQALEVVAGRLELPLDVASVASDVGLSASRFSHLFSRQVGESLPAYLERRRLERAEDLLRMTDRSIAEIARSVGYADPLYFSRRFSRRYGTSPRAWRRQER